MRILFYGTKPYDKIWFEPLAADYGYEITFLDIQCTAQTVIFSKGYDAICVFINDTIDAQMIDILYENGVQAVLLRSAGFNHVDIRAAKGKIKILRVPSYSPQAVAEYAAALLLTVNRFTHRAYTRTRDFNMSINGLMGQNLYRKTAGIIGTGKIGRVFADICKGFGMNILAYDKFPAANSGLHYVDLPELFAKSDILSLHCPLTEETRHIIDAASIAQMKKGVTIINTSRGALVNTEDLITGIKDKKVGAACLDVYEEEGDFFYEDFSGHIVQDDKLVRLIAMPTVIVTSHQAFMTQEALDSIASTTVDNLKQFFAGTPNASTEVRYTAQ